MMSFIYTERGRSHQVVANSLGIPCARLVGWVKAKEISGDSAFPGRGYVTAEEDRFRALERENERLKRERDILIKRALSIYAR